MPLFLSVALSWGLLPFRAILFFSFSLSLSLMYLYAVLVLFYTCSADIHSHSFEGC